jgi:hypothetical protein
VEILPQQANNKLRLPAAARLLRADSLRLRSNMRGGKRISGVGWWVSAKTRAAHGDMHASRVRRTEAVLRAQHSDATQPPAATLMPEEYFPQE